MKKTIIFLVLFYVNVFSQTYFNLHLSDNTDLTIEISEMDKITFNGSDVNFILTNSEVYTIAMSEISSLGAGASNGGSPLPVELTSFKAIVNENKVELSWQTATEVNNYGFQVQTVKDKGQRVKDKGQSENEWEDVGFVQGNGTTNSPKNYEFTDYELPNVESVDYRLKQIDNDGTFAYSKTITVDLTNITGVEEEEIPIVFSLSQNYPNPFNPTTTIKFGLPESGLVQLSVYNILGEEVARLVNKEMTAGYHEVNFGTNNIASGMYIYRISVENKFSATKKMLLVK